MRSGQAERSSQARRMTTRPIGSIDLNRAPWMLAEEMAKLRH